MLPAASRLRRRAEFSVTVRSGRKASRGSLVVHLAPAPEPEAVSPASETRPEGLPVPRAGFVVSKAVGNAVTRNKVKRRLRALVGSRLEGLPPGSSLVVRALPSAAARSYEKMGVDLDEALAAAQAPRRQRGGA